MEKKQKIIVVAGPPASGKTSVMTHTIKNILRHQLRVAVAKIDCLETDDDIRYSSIGIPVVVGLSNDICPDHYFVVNLEEIENWSADLESDILLIETAGLCHRCAPGLDKALSVCVIDCLSSIKVPRKIGPVATTADVIIITKGDSISQAEREVFRIKVRQLNPEATIIEANGITGGGTEQISNLFIGSQFDGKIAGARLRHSMPTAICSYCMGETRVGNKFQHGVVHKMDFKRQWRPEHVQ